MVAIDPVAAPAREQRAQGGNKFYLAAWRWHFYAGLYVAPFLVMLAVTGLIMMYIAYFDGRDGEKIAVTPGAATAPISAQAEAALAAFPEGRLVEWIGPHTSGHAAVLRIETEGTHHMVAVDPYTATVLESWVRRDGWYDFVSDIHGTLLIGDTGDRLIEIAAGLGIVLAVTGLYLWWPRNGKGLRSVLMPNLTARNRALWKSLHTVTGFYGAVLLVIFMLTGMAWAGIWGGKYVQAWSTFPAEKWDDVPLSDTTHASMNHGAIKDVPWGLEQTPMPASGSAAGVPGLGEGAPVNVDTIAALGRTLGYAGRYRIHYPNGETGVWTLSQDSMSNDSQDPTADRTVHVDQYTGKLLADVGFADYSVAAKGMAVGIAFHEGDMGLWNLVLNTIFCLGMVFLSVSGIVMWWVRRPARASFRLAAPPLPVAMPLWKGAVFIGLVLSLAFPLVGLTLIAVLALDLLVLSRIPALARAVS